MSNVFIDDWMHNPLCKGTMAHGWKCGEMGYCSDECMVIGSWKCGAAVAFGIVGWAFALRRNAPRCPSKREYWTSDLDGKRYYNCFCACCEHAYLKALDAGVDEGTDAEWCGECLC